MDDEEKIEAAAKAFLLGLFTGASAIEVTPKPDGGWVVRLVAPSS